MLVVGGGFLYVLEMISLSQPHIPALTFSQMHADFVISVKGQCILQWWEKVT